MKYVLSFSFALLGLHMAFAQTQWSGMVQQKPWTKSTESYCAQGSDYYVLELKTDTYVLEFADEKVAAQVTRMKGKRITVEGTLEKRVIQADPNSQHPIEMQQPVTQQPVKQRPVEQRPVTTRPGSQEVATESAFTCTVLRVTRVKPPKKQ